MANDRKKSKVGYCSPPEEHQFKKYQSGNPNGRPKKDRNTVATEMALYLRSDIEIVIDGRRRKVDRLTALGIRLHNDALIGKRGAAKEFFAFCEIYKVSEADLNSLRGKIVNINVHYVPGPGDEKPVVMT